MSLNGIFLIPLIIGTLSILAYEQDDTYYQVADSLSFNLRDTKGREGFFNNFLRKGKVSVYDKFLLLNNQKLDSYGLIHSRESFISDDVEIHLMFRLDNHNESGSIMALWLFKDDLEENLDHSYIGMPVKKFYNT